MINLSQMEAQADRIIEITKLEDLQLLFPEMPELIRFITPNLRINKFYSFTLIDDDKAQTETKILIIRN